MRASRSITHFALTFISLSLTTLASAADAPLRVMSFNLRYATAADGDNAWEKRKDVLLETIVAFKPDLLGTQETLALQADFLTEHLKDYKLVGVGRDDGKRKGEFSALLYKTSRFEAVDSGTFWLSETPGVPGSKSWDSSLPRIATWVKLRDHQNGNLEFLYLNTHWDHRGNQARVESGKLIRKWLAEHAAGLPAIVTGDLNVNDTHAGFLALTATGDGPVHLTDSYRQVHPETKPDEASFHNFSGNQAGRRIDFVLITPEWIATEAAIDHTNREGRYPSDHYPVTAVLKRAL